VVKRVVRFASFVGDPVTRVLLVVIGAIYLLRKRQWREALLLSGAVAGAGAVNTLVKKATGRARPRQSDAGGKSFPSGHTTGTLVFTASSVYLLWHATGERILALVVGALGIPLTGLVGLSRILSGDHYPGDVAGSYVVGGLWLAVLVKAAPRLLRREGASER
jgi:undecaprenyl-diphosphatase